VIMKILNLELKIKLIAKGLKCFFEAF